MQFKDMKVIDTALVATRPRQRCLSIFALPALLVLSACGGGGGSGDSPFDPDSSASCEVDYQNQWVYDNMRDYYLFYDQVPVVNPQSYDSTQDLLSSIRFEERDPFSHLADATASDLLFQEGREFGLGYRWGYDEDDNARILQVVEASPFGLAGIERGDIIVSVNGLDWQSDELSELFQEDVVGTPETPTQSNWRIVKRESGAQVDIPISTAEYAINSVEAVAEFTNPDSGSKTGYFVFNRFLNTSEQELRDTFQQFGQSGVSDLIVDLRYNSGGRVFIAEVLASLIAGNARAGGLLYRYEYNDKYQNENYDLLLEENDESLDLSRVIFITRSSTASSSEIVTLGLSPHMEVVTVGSTTSGKPYIQRGRVRCGEQLNAIEAEGFNAAGVSVFGGMPASCQVADDRLHDFGLNDDGEFEGMLKAGIDYLAEGSCATTIAAKSAGIVDQADETELQGFELFAGSLR
ncbi:S41 family peptidase [Granulosicoccus antarcticus]|uniref:Putative CtpA-like serine protease n=1 Tax=Granulosicoccus antarcticus IMCC3135 TaxID=1192854 RepID=A0A2Z2NRP7_9GAMM|nr:S41 family peptidase [Granulosicoccus antarcticus]ASJ72681.1 putative CtpA-like serine protease [Granulosicoccus antarcticus IMCC3135]